MGSTYDNAGRADMERRLDAMIQYRKEGHSWAEVAVVGGYSDKASAFTAVKRELAKRRGITDESLIELRQIEDLRDEDLRLKLHEIIGNTHYVVNSGKIVMGPDGVTPLLDDGPAMAAIDRLGRIAERYANRHGLNQPQGFLIALGQRTDVEAQVVADAVLAMAEKMAFAPDVRLRMLELAMEHLETAAAEEVEQPGDG